MKCSQFSTVFFVKQVTVTSICLKQNLSQKTEFDMSIFYFSIYENVSHIRPLGANTTTHRQPPGKCLSIV